MNTAITSDYGRTTQPDTLDILVVDDEPIARLVLSRPLEQLGHRIVQAGSGNDAIRIMEQQPIDLILLDIGMRDGDGFIVLKALRARNASRWVPVIITSGHHSDVVITRALDLGADDYMVKPLNINFLSYKIRNFQRVIALQKQNLGLLEKVTQKQLALQASIALELEYSTRIQKTLLFGSIPLDAGGIYTSARAQAAQGVNGDFIEVLSVYPDSVDLIVGDVMGKGALAAIMGADIKLQVQRQITNRLVSNPHTRFGVAEMVNAIHATMTPKLAKLESFVTFLYARIDKAAGTLTLVCCGHPSLLVVDAGRAYFAGSHNLPLGVLLDEVYEEETWPIGPGAAVISYSDGLSEARNEQGDVFGEDRLQELLQAHADASWGANAVLESIYATVLRFIGQRPLGDDLTLVVAKVPDKPVHTRRLILPRTLDRIAELRQFLVSCAQAEGLDAATTDRLLLVAVEAFTNTVRHASAELIYSAMEIQIHRLPSSVRLTLEALGPYFDWTESTLMPLEPTDLTREGGFGIHIIRSLSDDCTYAHAGGVNRSEFAFDLDDASMAPP